MTLMYSKPYVREYLSIHNIAKLGKIKGNLRQNLVSSMQRTQIKAVVHVVFILLHQDLITAYVQRLHNTPSP